jgi:hypothetical protein
METIEIEMPEGIPLHRAIADDMPISILRQLKLI